MHGNLVFTDDDIVPDTYNTTPVVSQRKPAHGEMPFACVEHGQSASAVAFTR